MNGKYSNSIYRNNKKYMDDSTVAAESWGFELEFIGQIEQLAVEFVIELTYVMKPLEVIFLALNCSLYLDSLVLLFALGRI